MPQPSPDGCRAAAASHQAPLHHRAGGQSDYRTVWVRLSDGDGQEGWGEAAPTKFYGETAESVLAALEVYATALPADPLNMEEAERRWETMLRENAAARAALSAALHDLAGKRLGVPVYRMWGLDPCKAPQSTFTIGLDTPERIRAKVLEAEQYPILKVKLGTDRDVEILRTIRERDRQGDPGRRQLRLDRKDTHPHAAGARGVRRHGAGAAAATAGSRRPRRDHRAGRHPGHRRRELHHGA